MISPVGVDLGGCSLGRGLGSGRLSPGLTNVALLASLAVL